MTEKQQHVEGQPGDPGSRLRFSRASGLAFVGLGLSLAFFAFRDIQRDCPLFTWDELSARIEMPVVSDSPGVQLVGNVTKTRHYGMFHHGATSACISGVTVLYEDHSYFFVETTPDGFFRSLIDRTRFPHIALEPIERHPISATSATGAVDEATQFLKSRQWD